MREDPDRRGAAAFWGALHLPRPTLRLRLTAIYGGLFLASGAALLALTYILVSSEFGGPLAVFGQNAHLTSGTRATVSVVEGRVEAVRLAQSELRQLLLWSGVALAAMAVVSIGLGWMVAGRVLRPLRTIIATTREISASNLHRRLDLRGPDDELTELGATFDQLLGRLDAAFESQRRFIANAAHELRTPLTRSQTMVEVALADPGATLDSLRDVARRVVRAGEEQERLLEALLTLARSERGIDHSELIDLSVVAGDVLLERQAKSGSRGLEIRDRLRPARASGDPRLLERLVANLVDNAIAYNTHGGWVAVETGKHEGRCVVSVANSGPAVPVADVGRLFQPFQRLSAARIAGARGSGLGLSIVQAIVTAHGGTTEAKPGSEGGLIVEVQLLAALAAAGRLHALLRADELPPDSPA